MIEGDFTRMSILPRVEIEEDLYSYIPADNGAGPFWCFGNTSIVECGGRVFAAGLETLPDVKPLSKCVPLLYVREDQGWRLLYRGEGRTREPSPLCCFEDGRVFLSLNTSQVGVEEYSGPSTPSILVFDAANPDGGCNEIFPGWAGEPPFTEHSYRSFVCDAESRELVIFQNIGNSHAEWAFMDADGNWSSNGQLEWLWGAEYDTPQPVRTCYPDVQLKNRGVYFCGVSDILEPYDAWRAYRKELTGKEWDYDFRRLLFTWSDDISEGGFHKWIEISSRDRTSGGAFSSDMLVDDDGTVHILWLESALDERLREKFFPLEKQTSSLNYVQIRNGVIRLRKALFVGGEGEAPGKCVGARLHRTADGRMLIIYNMDADATGGVSEMRIAELGSDGSMSSETTLNLEQPFSSFFTNTVRGGSPASDTLHLLGSVDNRVRYVKVVLE